MRRLEEVTTSNGRWMECTIICGVRIMKGLMLMMKW